MQRKFVISRVSGPMACRELYRRSDQVLRIRTTTVQPACPRVDTYGMEGAPLRRAARCCSTSKRSVSLSPSIPCRTVWSLGRWTQRASHWKGAGGHSPGRLLARQSLEGTTAGRYYPAVATLRESARAALLL